MDAGWKATFNGYFHWMVRPILEGAIEKLQSDPRYTYTVGDIAFFRHFYETLP